MKSVLITAMFNIGTGGAVPVVAPKGTGCGSGATGYSNEVEQGITLVSLDVTSLYTNISHNEGIDACRFFLQKRTNKHIPTETICDLIRIILTMNNFTFNSKHYLQKHGTAMGTRMAPSYANLSLGKFERDALLNSPHQPYLWLSFIDDIFMTWTAGPEKLKAFVDYLNNLHSTIKFTCSHSPSNIPFLDVMVSVKDGSIETDLYTNPLTNTSIY